MLRTSDLRCPIDQVANHPFIKGGTTETMTQYQLMGIRREIENVSDKVEVRGARKNRG